MKGRKTLGSQKWVVGRQRLEGPMAAGKGIFMQEQAGTRMKEAEVGGGWGGVGGPRVLGEGYSPKGMTVSGNRKVEVQKSGLGAEERPGQLGSVWWEEGPRTRGQNQEAGLRPSGSQTSLLGEKQEVKQTSKRGMGGLEG